MEQQRQSDEQDQQSRAQMQQQQQEQQQQYEQQAQPQMQGDVPQASHSQSGTRQAFTAPPHQVDPKTDTPANAIKRGDFTAALRLARPRALAGMLPPNTRLAISTRPGTAFR